LGDDGEVEIALGHPACQLRPEILMGVHQKVGVQNTATFEHEREEIRGKRGHGAHLDPPLKRWAVPEFLGGIIDVQDDPTHPFEEHLSGFCGHGTTAKTVKKLVAKLGFKALNLLT